MTRALLVFVLFLFFFFSLGFFISGFKSSNPKEKVGRSSSSASLLVAICS